jgi:hypothetical protein
MGALSAALRRSRDSGTAVLAGLLINDHFSRVFFKLVRCA